MHVLYMLSFYWRFDLLENKMKNLIIYGSCYGSTKQYALKFAKMTCIEVISYTEIKNTLDYDHIIYFGALYAGGLKGLKKSIKKIKKDTRLSVVTVGLADVNDDKTVNHIKLSLSRQIPDEFLENIRFFHLRGKIDYPHLHIVHKIMMKMLYLQVKHHSVESQDANTQLFLQTYGKKIDFVDFHSLSIIKDELKL